MPVDDTRRAEGLPAPGPQDEIPTQGLSPEANSHAPAVPAQPDNPSHNRNEYTFGPGDVLAERYRVIRFIARGGMGEVYEAEDLTLRGHVALKTIRPEIASNPTAVERFKREINVARRITHPNVSRIYDVGIHRGTPETMFLTMEFLAGESLHGRLTRNGRMTERELLPIAEQIAAGIAAAHEAGIIHRDFKSANVMLVPRPHNKGERAVVTDFGLARPAVSEDMLVTISESGHIMGTPAYMAPEQVRGRPLTGAADIYAFGIVLYELLTGRRPFEGDTPISLAVKRLTDPPPPPRSLVSTIDPLWDAVIIRCLDRDPSARFASALDVTHALRSGQMPPPRPVDDSDAPTIPLRSHPKLRRAPAIAGAVAVAGLTAGGLLWWPGLRSNPATPAVTRAAPAVVMRRGVAVLNLSDNSARSDTRWVSTAISEMLGTELGAGGKVRVTPGQDIARVKADLGLGDTDNISRDLLQRIGKSLDVDSIVLFSCTVIGDAPSGLIRIEARLVDAATGKYVGFSSTSGTETQLFDLVSRVGGGLRQKLGVGDLTPAQAVEVQAAAPSNREAVRLYAEGISKLRALDAAGAQAVLAKAAIADPKAPFIRSALSSAHAALGHETEARSEASRAIALSDNLDREKKLQMEARSHEATKDWSKAIVAETALWESFPDDLDYGLDLANAQISAGKMKEALVTIEALRKLPLPVSADGRIDLAEARAYQEMGDFAKEKKLAAAAAVKGHATNSRLLIARARMLEATALLALGDLAGTNAAIDEARSLFMASGDRGGVARALELTAQAVDRQGDLEGERKLLEQALATHREIGDKSSVARVLLNIGTILVSQGRTAEAQRFFDEAFTTFRQTGAKYAAAVAQNQIGMMMFNRGDLIAAQKHYQDGLTIFSELGEKTGTATTLSNIAEALECRGDLEQARKMHEDALAINREIGDKSGIAWDLFRLGEIFTQQGQLVAARDRYQEALNIQTQIGDKLAAADSRVALASLSIEQGNPVEAEKSAREAEEILRTGGAAERSALALAVVADALVAQGKQKQAYEVAQTAWKSAAKSEDRRIRFAVAVSVARAMAASKRPDDVKAALRFLETTRAEASRSLFVVSELEARLAAGEIELASGQAAAKKHLTSLEKDAKSKGFGRIAKRAAAPSA